MCPLNESTSNAAGNAGDRDALKRSKEGEIQCSATSVFSAVKLN